MALSALLNGLSSAPQPDPSQDPSNSGGKFGGPSALSLMLAAGGGSQPDPNSGGMWGLPGMLAKAFGSAQGPGGDPNSGGTASPLGPLGGASSGSVPFNPGGGDLSILGGGQDQTPAPYRGLGSGGSGGNIAPATPPTDRYSDMVKAALDRMNQGDQTVAGAYKQPMPAYEGPQFGLKDLLAGGLPMLALLLNHREGQGAQAAQFAAGFLGGKGDAAQAAYGRQMDQFQRQEQSQVTEGQLQSQQGQHMLQAAELNSRYQMMDQDKAMSQIHYLQTALDSAKPTDVPTIVSTMNQLYTRAGMPDAVISPAALKGLVDSKNLDLDQNIQLKNAATQFAAISNPKSTSGDLKTNSAALIGLINATNPDGSPKYPKIVEAYGAALPQIRSMQQNVPAFEQALQATAKMRTALAVMDGAKTETIDAIRKPTIDSIVAGTALKDATADYRDSLTQINGIKAQYLPKQLAAQTQLTYDNAAKAEQAVKQSKEQVIFIEDKIARLDQPSANTVAQIQSKWALHQAALQNLQTATFAKIKSLLQQKQSLMNGDISLPAGADKNLVSNQLDTAIAAAQAKVKGIQAESQQMTTNAANYRAPAAKGEVQSANPIAGAIGSGQYQVQSAPGSSPPATGLPGLAGGAPLNGPRTVLTPRGSFKVMKVG